MIINTLSERQLGKPKFYSIIYETIFLIYSMWNSSEF